MNLAIELVATRHRAEHRLGASKYLRPGISFLPSLEPLRCWNEDGRISVSMEYRGRVGIRERDAFVGGGKEKDFGHVVRKEVEDYRVVVEGERGVDVVDSAKKLVEDGVD